ncbi:MAG: peptide-methionine (S)-S-oxide reductase MsrA [Haloarculaceae archaeon]
MRTPADIADATADAFEIDATTPETVETATFGAGCFWGVEARFGALDGVIRTRVGYAGGEHADPTYDDLGDHTEVVQVDYDPARMDYGDALETFWAIHDPTTARKRQYRSLILAHDEAQRERARAHVDGIARQADVEVETDVEPYETLSLAEDYHQKYHLRSDSELLARFQHEYTPEQLVNSTAAARINAVAGGYGSQRTAETITEPFDDPPAPAADEEWPPQ